MEATYQGYPSSGGYVEGVYMPTRAQLACSHRGRTRLAHSEKGNGSMPVYTLLDISPKEKPASDILDLADDSDFELDLRVTAVSSGESASGAYYPTTTVNTDNCTSTCPDYYTCYGTCTAPGNGC